jgi:hypothetical protein
MCALARISAQLSRAPIWATHKQTCQFKTIIGSFSAVIAGDAVAFSPVSEVCGDSARLRR